MKKENVFEVEVKIEKDEFDIPVYVDNNTRTIIKRALRTFY